MHMPGVPTKWHQCKWKEKGDILQITLDLDRQTLKFGINNEDHAIAVKDITKTKYRLALSNECGHSGSKYAIV